ncbi:hypothetical protein Mp_5g16360 [Marchantia polymorpha subsp. ruderalis]|uniref:Uncharacterized protein n=2 Tax=Marchantia polymorpha TaxID=3197 RepID=A0A176VIS8_MARPO|nr:hypothetical protein AXG93_1748s1200 [Marchantia polymorpha subsp. ruderalis]PTQ27749.1 hypothetical protein MARPO_0185s0024 [Marchantia polymorpha]BBN11968.1 hypothetical protein Mp_5g16360 [Marchantia polymorpha subsp. ruderalis]|eukprot:PTQ27749.1 hypothetical protein MARPO_0185s0024 [Marchantia polymorpha]
MKVVGYLQSEPMPLATIIRLGPTVSSSSSETTWTVWIICEQGQKFRGTVLLALFLSLTDKLKFLAHLVLNLELGRAISRFSNSAAIIGNIIAGAFYLLEIRFES